MEIIKKYWKYLVPIIVSVFLLFFVLLFFAIPRIDYKYNKELNTYSVSHVYGNAKIYKIKSQIKNKDVSTINTRAFYKKNVHTIIMDENIEKVERLAFSECKHLNDINLSNVKYFENNSFSYCNNLKINELNAIEIGIGAFYGCKSITSIKLNEGLNSIGSFAFSKTSIKSIDIPASTTEIFNDAFSDIDTLEEINVYSTKLSLLSIDYLDSLDNVKINYL